MNKKKEKREGRKVLENIGEKGGLLINQHVYPEESEKYWVRIV